MTKITQIDFPLPYTLEEKYELAMSGEYGAFELFATSGDIQGYRGFRKHYGTTGVYASYKEALEAAFMEYGPKSTRTIESQF